MLSKFNRLNFENSPALERSSAEESRGGEFWRTGPAWDVKSGFRMGGGLVGVEVVIAQGLLDAVACVVLLGAAGTFPVKEKSLSADGAMNIRGAIGGFAKDLHMNSFGFGGS
jgi:hypothetical protein